MDKGERYIFVVLLLFLFCATGKVAHAAAPFGDTFDTYQNGNLYAQGLWQNYVYAWSVTDQGCSSGKCITSTGLNGINWKIGSDQASGEWHFRFYVAYPFGRDDFNSSVVFGSSQNPGQSSLALRNDTGRATFQVTDGVGNAMASGLAFGSWHTLSYQWDMGDQNNCTFSVSIDGGAPVPSAPAPGSSATCYGGVYAQHTIGSLGFSDTWVGQNEVKFDDVGEGPFLNGCTTNCDGTAPSSVVDNFDNFNELGWLEASGFGHLPGFSFDDGITGNCHSGGCLYAPSSAFMYKETGVAKKEGAYTLWVRAKSGWTSNFPQLKFELCQATWSTCAYETLDLGNVAQLDNQWHQVYVAWRQGATHMEVCTLRDDVDPTHCDWSEAEIPTGSTFDGVGLYVAGSTFGELRVDDLQDASDPSSCTKNCYSNVLFLPGIESSRLYRPGISEARLWEPSGDDNVSNQLAMYPDGSSVNADIYTRDVLDKATIFGVSFGIYDALIDTMNTLKKNGTINDWTAVPYDWRLSLEQILNSGLDAPNGTISYTQVTPTPYIETKLKLLAAKSKTGKVTIIAHSNGGLVAKALMQKLGPDAAKYVDKVILVAVPQLGTPEAIAELLHGRDAGIPLLISDAEVRSLALNMPMTYNLLPSAQYFASVSTPVATFATSTLPDWVSKYGNVIDSTSRLSNYVDDTSRAQPNFSDLTNPSVGNQGLFTKAQTTHATLDAWTPPSGVQLYEIAGWGDETVGRLDYSMKQDRYCAQWNLGRCVSYKVKQKLTMSPWLTLDGDHTVVTPSALWASGPSVKRYWMNLRDYNKDNKFSLPFGRAHKDLFEIPSLEVLVSNLAMNNTTTLPQYITAAAPKAASTDKRLRFTLHSPLTLEFYDLAGNHIGFSTKTNTTDYDVPGAVLERLGDTQWLSIPKDIAGTLVMHGIASGSFELDVDEVAGDTITASTAFVAIPSATSTIASMTVDPSISPTATGTLVVDEYGDGSQVMNLVPKVNSIATTYQFDGFLQPVNDTAHQVGQSLSVFKAGSTVPAKFQLKNLNGAVVQAAVAPVWLPPQQLSVMSASANETLSATTGSAGSTYSWDASTQQYTYNWNTKGLSAGYWYKVYAKLDDGTTQSVVIGLR